MGDATAKHTLPFPFQLNTKFPPHVQITLKTPSTRLSPTSPARAIGFYPAFEVTRQLDAAASEYVTHYPEGKQKSAVLPILHEIQKKFGFISADAIAWVGEN